MDCNDTKRKMARSPVHGRIACQAPGFNRTGAAGRRIPQVGKCSPYGGTSGGLRFMMRHYSLWCSAVIAGSVRLSTLIKPNQSQGRLNKLVTPPTVASTDVYAELPSFPRISYRLQTHLTSAS